MKTRRLLVGLLLTTLCVAGCQKPVDSSNNSSTNDVSITESNSSTTSSPSEEVVDYGTLTVKDMVAYVGNKPKAIDFSFSIADKAEEIEFIYDSESILIEDGKVTALIGGTSNTVTAKTAHHKTSFNVKCEALRMAPFGDPMHFYTSRDYFLQEQINRNVQPGCTVFAGDSFFDQRAFWTNFYSDVEGDAFITGIGSTAMMDWMCLAEKLIYDLKPANVVLHIGSNDFWDVHLNSNQAYSQFKQLINDIHANLPDAHIYYFGVENRTYSMPQYGGWDDPNALAISIEQLATFNKKAADYAAERDYLTFLDSPSYFTNEDGSCKAEMFKDGVHPNNEEYEFYVKALIEAGLDVKYTGSTKTLSDWTTAGDSVWNTSLKTIYDLNGKSLLNNYVFSGTMTINSKGGNAHIGFSVGGVDTRFLIWDSSSAGKFYYTAAFKGNYVNTSPSYLGYPLTKTINYKILVTGKSCYLIINDKVVSIMYNYVPSNALAIATEACSVSFTNNSVARLGDGTGVYEELLKHSTVAQYEASTDTSSKLINL